jgi:hypothetical protein
MISDNPRFNKWVPITKSDTVNVDGSTGVGTPTCDAIWVGGAGIVRAVAQDGTQVDFTVAAPTVLPIAAIRVMAGSTATLLVALYQI